MNESITNSLNYYLFSTKNFLEGSETFYTLNKVKTMRSTTLPGSYGNVMT